jgi:ABC-type dipeptide/oligopeptide/nickel transport system permease component
MATSAKAGAQPALDLVLNRLPATLALAGLALVITLILGLALGITAARSHTPLIRTIANGLIALGQAIPSFWLGAMLILIFAVNLDWLPSSGKSGWQSLILPAVTLAIQPAALLARLIATQLSETLAADYVRTARGKGLTEVTVVARHALCSSTGPILALLAIQTGFLIGGAVVVEGVFAYPGIGLLALNAVQDRDLPVIQSFVVVTAVLITLLTMSVDLTAKWLDPRLREASAA